tara:strand:+ start:1087 stop:2325 length:1239 start_codon:yes stop_codon:yes gene_type:complete
MKITDVEAFHINPRLASRNVGQKPRFVKIDTQTVYKITTDNGIVGYGDCRGHYNLADEIRKKLIDHNPFEFVNGSWSSGLMGALYDVMGKHVELPAYRLMGQKLRDRVPVAAWTRPASPEDLAAEVIRAANEGYSIFKMHTCSYYDVLEQHRAVEEVAPPGFLMHYDFNHNRTMASVTRLIGQLEKSPFVGFIEDPMRWQDLEGWRTLRQKTNLPIVMHVPQLGGGPEIIHGCADLYMVGESGLDTALQRGYACGQANLSTVIQMTGGTLCKALAMHLGAVLPNVSHSINLDDQYEEDVTGVRIEVAEGSSPVPEEPGLGVSVDESEFERIAENPETELPRYITCMRLPRGGTHTMVGWPNVDSVTGFAEGNIRAIRIDVEDDDGSDRFDVLYKKLEKEGPQFLNPNESTTK